jgi:hypothetical protein
MSKHILDSKRTRSDEARLERYAELDRRESGGARPQADAILKEPPKRKDGTRLKHFTKIERTAG